MSQEMSQDIDDLINDIESLPEWWNNEIRHLINSFELQINHIKNQLNWLKNPISQQTD